MDPLAAIRVIGSVKTLPAVNLVITSNCVSMVFRHINVIPMPVTAASDAQDTTQELVDVNMGIGRLGVRRTTAAIPTDVTSAATRAPSLRCLLPPEHLRFPLLQLQLRHRRLRLRLVLHQHHQQLR